MNYSYFKDYIYIKSRIIGEDLESLLSSFKNTEDASKFMLGLYGVMLFEKFILLDEENLSKKIYNFINAIAFRFKDSNIRNYRRVIASRIINLTNKSNEEKQRIIDEIIQIEKKERSIPENFNITKEEILKMYSLDFKNHYILCQNNGLTHETDLFYFLTTVNKVNFNYNDNYDVRIFKSGFISAMADFKIENYDNDILNYVLITRENLETFDRNKQILTKKIVKFPTDESISS